MELSIAKDKEDSVDEDQAKYVKEWIDDIFFICTTLVSAWCIV